MPASVSQKLRYCAEIVTHGDSSFIESPAVGEELTVHRVERKQMDRKACNIRGIYPFILMDSCIHDVEISHAWIKNKDLDPLAMYACFQATVVQRKISKCKAKQLLGTKITEILIQVCLHQFS